MHWELSLLSSGNRRLTTFVFNTTCCRIRYLPPWWNRICKSHCFLIYLDILESSHKIQSRSESLMTSTLETITNWTDRSILIHADRCSVSHTRMDCTTCGFASLVEFLPWNTERKLKCEPEQRASSLGQDRIYNYHVGITSKNRCSSLGSRSMKGRYLK